MKIYFSLLGLLFTLNLSAASFEGTTSFEVEQKTGTVSVWCTNNDSDTLVHHKCSEDQVAGGDSRYFNLLTPTGASVLFKVARSDGRELERLVEFDSSEGRTASKVKIFGKAGLFSVGSNRLAFTLFDEQNIKIYSKVMDIEVVLGAKLKCSHQYDFADAFNSCNDKAYFCRRYLAQNNNCQ